MRVSVAQSIIRRERVLPINDLLVYILRIELLVGSPVQHLDCLSD